MGGWVGGGGRGGGAGLSAVEAKTILSGFVCGPSARDAFTQTQLVSIFEVSAGLSAEGSKMGV